MQPKISPFLLLLICIPFSDAGAIGANSSSPSSSHSTLDPKQLTALHALGLSTVGDPCATPSPHGNATACDAGRPFRHLVSLRLSNCSDDLLDLPSTALRSLSTLTSLSFFRCPVLTPRHLPLPSLRSFSCSSSLRHLSSLFLSRLRNLTSLSVTDSPVSGSGPVVILSQMPLLRFLTISNSNLSGQLPRHWHSLDLLHVDLSSNNLKGPIPSSISLLSSLQSLNLSSNFISGEIPNSIGDLLALKNATFSHNSISGPIPDSFSTLSSLIHLDLSFNRLNGTLPSFFSAMKNLRYLNLENNDFHGMIPYNASFIKRLQVFKVAGNSNLCYNHTLLSSKLGLGVAKCDKYGLPVSPPPAKTSDSDSSDYNVDDGNDSGDGGRSEHHGGGPNKLVLVVAIALSCFVFLVLFLVCVSKVCGCR